MNDVTLSAHNVVCANKVKLIVQNAVWDARQLTLRLVIEPPECCAWEWFTKKSPLPYHTLT